MKLEDFYTWNDITKKYRSASLENAQLILPAIREVGKMWTEVSSSESLFLTGDVRGGKTYFAIALAKILVCQGAQVIFKKSGDLDRELLNLFPQWREADILKKYQEVDVLIIDDFGVERHTDRILEQYYAIIDYRLGEEKPTIYTSNLDLSGVDRVLGNRIASRIEETCMVIEFPTIPLQDRKR